MDFGIARLADEVPLTAAGDVVGTLAYMSPEQAEGREAGPEADVYSLALTLYECWSGENPHRRATPAATARAIGGRARSLRKLRPDLPRELSEQIDACLSSGPTAAPRWRSWGRDRGLARRARRRAAGRAPPRTWRCGSAASPSPPRRRSSSSLGHGALLP